MAVVGSLKDWQFRVRRTGAEFDWLPNCTTAGAAGRFYVFPNLYAFTQLAKWGL